MSNPLRHLAFLALPLGLSTLLPAQAAKPDALLLATACNQFAADLHHQLANTGSPTAGPGSIAIALLMLVPGARDSTLEELRTVLHLPADLRGARLETAAKELLGDCAGSGKNDGTANLRVANGIWAQQGHTFVQAYIDTLRQAFAVKQHLVDFRDTEAARQAINADISKSTNDRIKQLIPPNLLSPLTRIVLTDAMWFKAAWEHPFEAYATSAAPFTRLDGSKIDVLMMRTVANLRCADSEAWRAVEMRFKDSTVVCEVVVPRDGHQLAEAEQALLSDAPRRAFAPQQLTLGLPKFRIAATQRLKQSLVAMGLRLAFTEDANFRGIDAKDPLWIDEVVHQTWVQVDENGAEAAAATAIVMKDAGATSSREQLIVDRPFAFALRESRTGLLLFVGRVEDPSATPQ